MASSWYKTMNIYLSLYIYMSWNVEINMDTMENLWINTQSFHKIHGKSEIS